MSESDHSQIKQNIDRLNLRLYAQLIEYTAERLANDSAKYAQEFMAKKFSDVSIEFLVDTINANMKLSDAQKAQIVYILQTNQAPHIDCIR